MDKIKRNCPQKMIVDEKTKLIASGFVKYRVSDVENEISFRNMTSLRFGERKPTFQFPKFVRIFIEEQDCNLAVDCKFPLALQQSLPPNTLKNAALENWSLQSC